MTIKVRRATENQRRTRILASGEFVFCDDSKKLYLGNGTENPKEIKYSQITDKIICSNLLVSIDTSNDDEIQISAVIPTTDDILEGNCNKYFTKEKVIDIIDGIYRQEFVSLFELLNQRFNKEIVTDSMTKFDDVFAETNSIQNKINEIEGIISNVNVKVSDLDNSMTILQAYLEKAEKYSELIFFQKSDEELDKLPQDDSHSMTIGTVESALNRLELFSNNLVLNAKATTEQVPTDENQFCATRPTGFNMNINTYRNTSENPESLRPKDSVGKILFNGHNNHEFKSVAAICVEIDPSIEIQDPLAGRLVFYVRDFMGSEKFTGAILDSSGIFSSLALRLFPFNSESERDLQYPKPKIGTITFISPNSNTQESKLQIYTGSTWSNLG